MSVAAFFAGMILGYGVRVYVQHLSDRALAQPTRYWL